MMRIPLILIMCLVLVAAVNAQTNPASSPQSENPESARAKQLNASMIEMYQQGKYDEALSLAKQRLEIIGKVEGENSLPYANALDDVAAIYVKKPKYDDAITFHQRALSIYEKLSGMDSPDVLRPLYELAVLYDTRNDSKKAEPLYRRAVAIKDRVSGFNNLDDALMLLRYSCTMRRNKNPEADSTETRAFSLILKEKGDQLDKIHLPGECLRTKAISLPPPRYPAEARAARATGKVEVEVLVDETGKVISARALNGPATLRNASVQASYVTRFQPTIVGGRGFKVWGIITYTFTISP